MLVVISDHRCGWGRQQLKRQLGLFPALISASSHIGNRLSACWLWWHWICYSSIVWFCKVINTSNRDSSLRISSSLLFLLYLGWSVKRKCPSRPLNFSKAPDFLCCILANYSCRFLILAARLATCYGFGGDLPVMEECLSLAIVDFTRIRWLSSSLRLGAAWDTWY